MDIKLQMEPTGVASNEAVSRAKAQLGEVRREVQAIFGPGHVRKLTTLASLCGDLGNDLARQISNVEKQLEVGCQDKGDQLLIPPGLVKDLCPDFPAWNFCYRMVSLVFPILSTRGEAQPGDASSPRTSVHAHLYSLVDIINDFVDEAIKTVKLMDKQDRASSETLNDQGVLSSRLDEHSCGLNYLINCRGETAKLLAECKQIMNRNLFVMKAKRKEKVESLSQSRQMSLKTLDEPLIKFKAGLLKILERHLGEESFSGNHQLPLPPEAGDNPGASNLKANIRAPTLDNLEAMMRQFQVRSSIHSHLLGIVTTFDTERESEALPKFRLVNERIRKHFSELYKTELTKSPKLSMDKFDCKWELFCEIFRAVRDPLRRHPSPRLCLDLPLAAEQAMSAFLARQRLRYHDVGFNRQELAKRFGALFIGLL